MIDSFFWILEADEGDVMELVVVVIALAVFMIILAFLLGFMISRGEESVSEHAAYLRGVKDGKRLKEEEMRKSR